MPVPALEVLLLFAAVGMAAIAFMAHWLTPNEGVVLDALLLVLLLGLSWQELQSGPASLFPLPGMLLLCQGGRFLTYSLGSEPDPLRVRIETRIPFDLSAGAAGHGVAVHRLVGGMHLRCLPFELPSALGFPTSRQRTAVFALPVPALLLKRAGTDIQELQLLPVCPGSWRLHVLLGEPRRVRRHCAVLGALGFAAHACPASSASFSSKSARKYLYLATTCYFLSSLLLLLMGSRMGTLGLIVALWYAAGIKSGKKTQDRCSFVLAWGIVHHSWGFSGFARRFRQRHRLCCRSLEVRDLVGQFAGRDRGCRQVRGTIHSLRRVRYMWNELTFGFSPHDLQHYFRGRELGHDVSMLLDAERL